MTPRGGHRPSGGRGTSSTVETVERRGAAVVHPESRSTHPWVDDRREVVFVRSKPHFTQEEP